mmetsp:Transcript_36500/g.62974  ORF Transcript_36500/g.62974 Transcript_36500/m.62974 type:complete len:231 (-) Transcript_36500:1007-1699(-)
MTPSASFNCCSRNSICSFNCSISEASWVCCEASKIFSRSLWQQSRNRSTEPSSPSRSWMPACSAMSLHSLMALLRESLHWCSSSSTRRWRWAASASTPRRVFSTNWKSLSSSAIPSWRTKAMAALDTTSKEGSKSCAGGGEVTKDTSDMASEGVGTARDKSALLCCSSEVFNWDSSSHTCAFSSELRASRSKIFRSDGLLSTGWAALSSSISSSILRSRCSRFSLSCLFS